MGQQQQPREEALKAETENLKRRSAPTQGWEPFGVLGRGPVVASSQAATAAVVHSAPFDDNVNLLLHAGEEPVIGSDAAAREMVDDEGSLSSTKPVSSHSLLEGFSASKVGESARKILTLRNNCGADRSDEAGESDEGDDDIDDDDDGDDDDVNTKETALDSSQREAVDLLGLPMDDSCTAAVAESTSLQAPEAQQSDALMLEKQDVERLLDLLDKRPRNPASLNDLFWYAVDARVLRSLQLSEETSLGLRSGPAVPPDPSADFSAEELVRIPYIRNEEFLDKSQCPMLGNVYRPTSTTPLLEHMTDGLIFVNEETWRALTKVIPYDVEIRRPVYKDSALEKILVEIQPLRVKVSTYGTEDLYGSGEYDDDDDDDHLATKDPSIGDIYGASSPTNSAPYRLPSTLQAKTLLVSRASTLKDFCERIKRECVPRAAYEQLAFFTALQDSPEPSWAGRDWPSMELVNAKDSVLLERLVDVRRVGASNEDKTLADANLTEYGVVLAVGNDYVDLFEGLLDGSEFRTGTLGEAAGSRGLLLLKHGGLRGLQNLGNTCFLNSALQCLSHTLPLSRYFLSGDYEKDINRVNPLGMKGQLAEAYAKLLSELWSGKRSAYTPSRFKRVIGAFAPQFMGFQQQDSQELTAFLLDGLHEDLNRVIEKPYTEAPDSDESEEEALINNTVLADEAWALHKRRNDSLIVDTLQGQYRSRLECPECHKVSVVFDPFMYLSVPIPHIKKKFSVIVTAVLPYFGTKRAVVVDLQLLEGWSVAEATSAFTGKLIEAVKSAQFQVERQPDRLQSGVTPVFVKSLTSLPFLTSSDDIFAERDLFPEGADRYYVFVVAKTLLNNLRHSKRLRLAEKSRSSVYLPPAKQRAPALGGQPLVPVSLYDDLKIDEDVPVSQLYPSLLRWQPASRTICIPMILVPARNSPLEVTEAANTFGTVPTLLPVRVNWTCHEVYDLIRSVYASDFCTRDSESGSAVPAMGGVEEASRAQCGGDGDDGEAHPMAVDRDTTKIPPSDLRLFLHKPAATAWDTGSYHELLWGKSVSQEDVNRVFLSQAPEKAQFISVDQVKAEIRETTVVSYAAQTMGVPVDQVEAMTIIVVSKQIQYEVKADPASMKTTSAEEGSGWLPEEGCAGSSGGACSDGSVNLYGCLDAYVASEQLGEDDMWYCRNCKMHRPAIKKIDLWRLPPVLVVHLKRFAQINRFSRRRDNTLVRFPADGEILDLSRYLLPDAPTQGNHNAKYELFAVSHQIGNMQFGHYTASAKCAVVNPTKGVVDKKWYLFDDTMVDPIAPPLENRSSTAYMLFYQLVGTDNEVLDGLKGSASLS